MANGDNYVEYPDTNPPDENIQNIKLGVNTGAQGNIARQEYITKTREQGRNIGSAVGGILGPIGSAVGYVAGDVGGQMVAKFSGNADEIETEADLAEKETTHLYNKQITAAKEGINTAKMKGDAFGGAFDPSRSSQFAPVQARAMNLEKTSAAQYDEFLKMQNLARGQVS